MRELVFGFRVSESERQVIQRIARRLNRSEADVMRLLIREAALAMDVEAQGVRLEANVRPVKAEAVGK